ncbi:helix-turn-helix domain-containing protein [Aquimarina pacifica]|uniref:hypothetical protein n=1 Tax=Aquimarina pacifica TaxID=1296415 RepID=UPI00055079B3|nr:hypothetical protein [Aquimarina pacifica]
MISFYKASRFLFFSILLSVLVVPVSAQKTEDSIVRKRIKADYKKYSKRNDKDAHANHLRILKEAVMQSFFNIELACYTVLVEDHSYGHIGSRSLDSVLYYCDKYESAIAVLDSSKFTKNLSSRTAHHYLTKGNVLTNGFGLIEPGLASFFKAYPYIDKNDINQLTKYDVLVSQTYTIKEQYNRSLQLLNNRLKDTIQMNDATKKLLFINLAKNYRLKKMPEQSFTFNNKALFLANKSTEERYKWYVKGKIPYDYFLFGDYQKAIDSLLAVRAYFKKIDFKPGLFNTAEGLADFYFAIGNIDKAIYYGEKNIDFPFSVVEVSKAHGNLAKFHKAKKEYSKAIFYYEKENELIDSIRSFEKRILVNYSDAQMKLIHEKQKSIETTYKNQLLEEKNKAQELYSLIVTVLLIFVLLVLSMLYLYRKYNKSKKDVVILRTNEKQLLEEQIRLRDNELDATAIALSQRVEVLNTIKKELALIKDDNPKLAQVNNTLKDLILSASDVSAITDRIESQYPTVATELRMKHPELTENEIRYCLLTKLNLSLKETASMLNVSPNTVKVTRSRLKKKMGIDQTLSFKQYLDTMYMETAASVS